MGWETRARGTRYYTRSRRVGGRVVREYVGSGPAAEAIAALDARERAERAQARARQRAERERLDAVDKLVAAFCRDVDTLTRAALETAGYHQHDRGEWRKRRAPKEA